MTCSTGSSRRSGGFHTAMNEAAWIALLVVISFIALMGWTLAAGEVWFHHIKPGRRR